MAQTDDIVFDLSNNDNSKKIVLKEEEQTFQNSQNVINPDENSENSEINKEIVNVLEEEKKKELAAFINEQVELALKKNAGSSVSDSDRDSLLAKILLQISSQNNEFLNTQKQMLQLQKKKVFGITSIDQSEIEVEDILEKPAVFFAWGFSTVIADDFVGGVTIQPPYGKAIPFNHLYRMPTGQRGSGKYASYSYAVIYSKKQCEFLRKHSDFGIRIFERLTDAKAHENDYMNYIITANDEIKRMSPHQMLMAARNLNIQITSMDMAVIKGELLKKMAESKALEMGKRLSHTLDKVYGDINEYNQLGN